MRALLTSALLAATLTACATRSPAVVAAQPQIDAPLSARLFPPQYGQIAVGLSKPAFVALFEVVPGRGAALVYPTAGTGFTPVLETWVPLRYNPQRWLYARNHAAANWRPSARYTGYGYGYGSSAFGGQSSGPRYFFLVASEDPIAVEQFQSEASSMRRYLGVSYDSYRPYDVMEELAYALLPYAGDERWVTDVIVDWGYDWGYGYGPMASYSYARWEPVVCADGSVRMARYVSGWGYDNLPCQLRGTQRPPVLPVDPNDPGTPPDSAGDGRDRVPDPNEKGRTRAGSAGEADVTTSPEEVRRRITELREDAARTRFSDELNQTLRRSVQIRQRADELAGGTFRPATGSSRTVRTSPSRQADEAYRRADAARERERRQAERPTRSSAGQTRSRAGQGSSARSGRSSSGESSSSGSASSGRGSSGSSSTSSGSSSSGSSSSGSTSSGSGSSSSGSTGSGRTRIPPPAN